MNPPAQAHTPTTAIVQTGATDCALIYGPRRPSMFEWCAIVAERHDITVRGLLGRRTDDLHARARHEAMYLIRQNTRHSLPQIARFFDRDHTTVLYGVRSHERRLRSERVAAA